MKIIKVEMCLLCPYRKWTLPEKCSRTQKIIEKIKSIPEWCPLESTVDKE